MGKFSDAAGYPIEPVVIVDANGIPLILGGGVPVFSQPFSLALDYDGSNNLIYLGMAATGSSQAAAAWYIRQLNYTSGNLVSMLSANGTVLFNQIWNNRVSLSYS